jgi:hypothetical protein
MAAYLGEVGVFRAIVPRPTPLAALPSLPHFNFIDDLVDAKLAKLNVAPSPVCGDAEFLRRAYLDLTGTLPTAAAARTDRAPPDRRRAASTHGSPRPNGEPRTTKSQQPVAGSTLPTAHSPQRPS